MINKKIISVLLMLVIVLSMFVVCACGDNNNDSSSDGETATTEDSSADNSDTDSEDNNGFDSEKVEKQIKIKKLGSFVREYYDETDRGYAITAKNNSDYDIELSCTFKFLDKDNKPVSSLDSETVYLHKGGTALLFAADEMEGFKDVDIVLDVGEIDAYLPAKKLKTKSTLRSDQVIVEMTNEGKEDVSYANASVAFYKGKRLVDCANDYCTNDDDVLEAGKTRSVSIEWNDTDKSVDKAKVYTDGYIEKE